MPRSPPPANKKRYTKAQREERRKKANEARERARDWAERRRKKKEELEELRELLSTRTTGSAVTTHKSSERNKQFKNISKSPTRPVSLGEQINTGTTAPTSQKPTAAPTSYVDAKTPSSRKEGTPTGAQGLPSVQEQASLLRRIETPPTARYRNLLRQVVDLYGSQIRELQALSSKIKAHLQDVEE